MSYCGYHFCRRSHRNKWLADYREYEVLIEPEDIDVYKEVNKEFYEHFSYFNYDFNLAMKCATDWKRRSELAKRDVEKTRVKTLRLLINRF